MTIAVSQTATADWAKVPTISVRLDQAMTDAWVEACEWARGPACAEICVRELFRGMLASADTSQVLEREYEIDRKAAGALVAREIDSAGTRSERAPECSNRLQRLLHLAAARALETGGAEVTTQHVVDALWQMPGEERLSETFPEFRRRRDGKVASDEQMCRERAALAGVDAKLDALITAWQGDQQTSAARLQAIEHGLGQLRSTVLDAPGLEVRVDKLRTSFGALHTEIDKVEQRVAKLDEAASAQSARVNAGLDGLARELAGRTEALAQESARLSAKIDECTRPWWRRIRGAQGTG
jgi:hypothetical protein